MQELDFSPDMLMTMILVALTLTADEGSARPHAERGLLGNYPVSKKGCFIAGESSPVVTF